MDTVTLVLCATFFVPFGPTWFRITIFAFGILGYIVHNWRQSIKTRQSFSKSFILSIRTATLLTLLASWTWSDITVPYMASSDRILRGLVQSLPENVTISFSMNTTRLTISDLNGSIIERPLHIKLDRSFLDAFRLEIPQTPVVDWIQMLQTAGGTFEVLYRAFFGSWVHTIARPSETNPLIVDVTEFRVGDRVLSGGKRLGQQRKAGTIARVLPAPVLERFAYEVEWDADDHQLPSVVPAIHLVPEESIIYFYPHVGGTLPRSSLPRDALAVFTDTNVTILEGFSHYYGQYWRYRKGQPSRSEDDDSHAEARRRRMENLEEGVCPVIEEPVVWSEISRRAIEKWKPLAAMATILCEKNEYISLDCSRTVAERNIAQLRNTLYPLIGVTAEEEEVAWFRIARYYLWWLFFFSCQTAVLFSMTLISVCCVFAPACYVVVNSFRHVDEAATTYSTVLHMSLRTYDSLSLTYHLAVALIRDQAMIHPLGLGLDSPFKATANWASMSVISRVSSTYLQFFGVSVAVHWLANCFLLFNMRMTDEARYEEERKLQLEARKKKKRHPTLPHRKRSCSQESLNAFANVEDTHHDTLEDDADEPCCRICFSSGGQLVSPCCCDGSMRYVHLDCLSEWRFRSMHTESFVRCDQCKYRYKIRKTWLGLTLRSSLCLSIMSLVCITGLCFAGAIFFKLLDAMIIGKRLSEYSLGPKLSFYVREHAWPAGSGPPSSYMEQRFVETATFYLGMVSLELGHMVNAFIALGIIGFLTSDSYAVPWLWGTSDDTGSQEEGWLVYVGGRIGIVVLIGHYRLFSMLWGALKVRTAKLISTRETTLVPIEPLDDEVKKGSVLRTPYGKVRVKQYREDDDVLETEFVNWRGAKMYRRGSESVQQDEADHAADEQRAPT